MMWSFLIGIFFVAMIALQCSGRPLDDVRFKDEVAEFNELLDDVLNTEIPQSKRDEAKGRLKLKFEDTLKKAIQYEDKLAQINKENTDKLLQVKDENTDKLLQVKDENTAKLLQVKDEDTDKLLQVNKENTDKLLQINAEKEIIEKDKERYFQTVRRLNCGAKIRRKMEVFSTNFGLDQNEMYKNSEALRETLSYIQRSLKERALQIEKQAHFLKQLYQEYRWDNRTENVVLWHQVWTNKIKSAYRRMKDVPIMAKPDTTENNGEPNLHTLLWDFQQAKDESDAALTFERQCDIYHSWSCINVGGPKEWEEILKMAVKLAENRRDEIFNKAQSELKVKPELTIPEKIYIQDLFEVGTYFILKKNKPRYEDCTEVFYFSPPTYVEELKSSLAKQWPEMAYTYRVDTFCMGLVALYDLVSVTDRHAAGDANEEICQPNSTDYYNLLDRMGSMHPPKKTHIFIFSLLGLISSN